MGFYKYSNYQLCAGAYRAPYSINYQQLFQIPSVSDGFGFILFGNRTCHHACVIPGTIPDKRPRLTVASKFVDGDQVILGINSIVQCSWIGMDCEAKPFGPPGVVQFFILQGQHKWIITKCLKMFDCFLKNKDPKTDVGRVQCGGLFSAWCFLLCCGTRTPSWAESRCHLNVEGMGEMVKWCEIYWYVPRTNRWNLKRCFVGGVGSFMLALHGVNHGWNSFLSVQRPVKRGVLFGRGIPDPPKNRDPLVPVVSKWRWRFGCSSTSTELFGGPIAAGGAFETYCNIAC